MIIGEFAISESSIVSSPRRYVADATVPPPNIPIIPAASPPSAASSRVHPAGAAGRNFAKLSDFIEVSSLPAYSRSCCAALTSPAR